MCQNDFFSRSLITFASRTLRNRILINQNTDSRKCAPKYIRTVNNIILPKSSAERSPALNAVPLSIRYLKIKLSRKTTNSIQNVTKTILYAQSLYFLIKLQSTFTLYFISISLIHSFFFVFTIVVEYKKVYKSCFP